MSNIVLLCIKIFTQIQILRPGKITTLALAILLFCFLPTYGHGDDESFETKNEELEINSSGIKALNIETAAVNEVEIDEKVILTGQIEELPNSHFDVNSSVQGKVVSILVDLGSIVYSGQPLAVIQSTDITKLQAEVDQTEAELELAKNNFDRESILYEKGVSAKKELDAAKALLLSNEAKVRATKASLNILTGNGGDVEQGTFTIRAPKSGTIIERNITIGQIINENQRVFHGFDLNTVWASGDAYEKDIGKIHKNQKVSVILDGLPNQIFSGNISYVGSIINPETRTLPVKATLTNRNNLLNPGAFLQFIIHTGQKKKSLIIPRTALLETDKEGTEGKHDHLVYIKIKNKFIPRKIHVESHDSDYVEVLSGLNSGDVVVTRGAYQLQYGESKDSHKEDHGHEEPKPEKQNHVLPPWSIVGAGIFGLLIGILIGKRKKSNNKL